MNPPTFSEQLQQAAEAARQHDYATAVQIYDDLLGAVPADTADSAERRMRLTALRERGRFLDTMGEPQAALAAFEQYYLEAGSSDKAVDALVLIGNQQTYIGLHQQALATHQEALQLAEALNDTYGRAQAIGGMGLVLSRLGRNEEAIINLHQSLSLFEQIDNKIEQARAWNRVAVAHVHLGQVDRSIAALKTCLLIAADLGLHDSTTLVTTINALSNLGECYQQLYDMKQALSYHMQALATVAGYDLTSMEADTRRNIGVELRHLGRVDEGLDYLYEALHLAEETLQPDVKLQALYSLALAEMERGKLEVGLQHAQRLRALAESEGLPGHRAEALHAIGLYHKLQDDTAVTGQLWQQGLFLAHETGRRYLLWQLHAGLADIAVSTALAEVHYRIAAEVIGQIAEPISDEEIKQKFLKAPIIARILAKASN